MNYPVQGPAISTDTNKMTVVFKSNHLFRYQGFKCRYRAIQPNGIAVINSFGDTGADSEEGKPFVLNVNGSMQIFHSKHSAIFLVTLLKRSQKFSFCLDVTE